MQNMDKGLTVPKMGADNLAKSIPNAPELNLPKPKSSEFH